MKWVVSDILAEWLQRSPARAIQEHRHRYIAASEEPISDESAAVTVTGDVQGGELSANSKDDRPT